MPFPETRLRRTFLQQRQPERRDFVAHRRPHLADADARHHTLVHFEGVDSPLPLLLRVAQGDLQFLPLGDGLRLVVLRQFRLGVGLGLVLPRLFRLVPRGKPDSRDTRSRRSVTSPRRSSCQPGPGSAAPTSGPVPPGRPAAPGSARRQAPLQVVGQRLGRPRSALRGLLLQALQADRLQVAGSAGLRSCCGGTGSRSSTCKTVSSGVVARNGGWPVSSS